MAEIVHGLAGARRLLRLLAVLLAAGVGLGTMAGRLGAEPLRSATPLVLKDGRVAQVTVYGLPVTPGAEDLDPAGQAELTAIIERVATDCFLTAQAIGHVEAAVADRGDTLAAHRLARARAERVQKAMTERGMPASAIASVWDWQFVVREPRVTLWVFQLHQGEDCEGKLLPKAGVVVAGQQQPRSPEPTGTTARTAADKPEGALGRGAEAASAPSGASGADKPAAAPTIIVGGMSRATAEGVLPVATAAQRPGTPPDTTVGQPEGQKAAKPAGRTVEAAGEPARPGKDPEAAATRAPVPMPKPATGGPESAGPAIAAKPGAVGAPVAGVVAPGAVPPAASPARSVVEHTEEPDKAVAAAPPRPLGERDNAGVDAAGAASSSSSLPMALTAEAAGSDQKPASEKDDEAEASAAAAAAGSSAQDGQGVEIVFDVNSSYLPKGTSSELKRFLSDLGRGRRLAIELLVSVGGEVKVANSGQADRYNRWMAERRAERIAEWLRQNAAGRTLDVTPTFRENDDSRRVVVRTRSMP